MKRGLEVSFFFDTPTQEDCEFTITGVEYTRYRPATLTDPEEPSEPEFEDCYRTDDPRKLDVCTDKSYPLEWRVKITKAIYTYLSENRCDD
jgi:hypothetical protein